MIECRGETPTKCGWPEFTGGLDQLLLSLREKGQDAKPERETFLRFEFSSILLAAIDPATRYTSMQPPSAKLCSHPLLRYPATDLTGQNIIHAAGVLGKLSVTLNPVSREL